MKPLTKASLYMILTAVLFAVMGLQVRLLAPRIGGGQSLFVRSVLDTIFTVVAIRLMGGSYFGQHHKALMSRGLFGALSGLAYFEAVTRIALADAIGIYRSSALFMPLVALVALKEALNLRRCFYAVLGFIGVVFLVKPGFAIQQDGAWVALLGAMLNACAWASVRSVAVRESALTIILYFYVCSAILTAAIYGHGFVMPDLAEWLKLLIMAISGFVGQITLTKAYALASATAITPLGYVEIPLMIIFGWLFFAELPDLWSLLGIGIVALMGVLIVRDREERVHKLVKQDAIIE